MSLVVQGLHKRFPETDHAALNGVSFAAPAGGITALLGPSGSGKTTVLRLVAGLERPDAGSILLDGVDATGMRPQDRGVGFVFQSYALFEHMTVRENVAFGLRVRRTSRAEREARVDELLKLVQLDGLGHRHPSKLSGGQRQRVAFARALAIRPRILLLDEPFSALDAAVRIELREWLRALHDETHVTTLFITHDEVEALALADHVVRLRAGRVEAAHRVLRPEAGETAQEARRASA